MRNRVPLLFVICSLFVFFSCNKKDKDVVSIIPTNATSVIRINAQSIILKSEYDLFKNQKITTYIAKMQKIMNADQKKLLTSFLEDANSLGLDLKNELYVYTDSINIGILTKVLDSKKFQNSLLNSGLISKSELQKDGDLYYISKYYPDFIFAWDDNRFLLIQNAQVHNIEQSDKDNTIAHIKAQMSQPYDESIAANAQFKEFLSSKDDISIFTNLSNLNKKGLSPIDFLSLDKFTSNINLVSGINFEVGKINISNKYLYKSAEYETHYSNVGHKLFGSLHSDQLAYIPQDYMMALSANIHGKEIDALLDRNYYKNNLFLKNLLTNVDGDITVAFNPLDNNGLTNNQGLVSAQIAIMAEVNDPQSILYSFIALVEEQGIGNSLKIDPLAYKISFLTNDELYVRVIDKTISVTNDENIDISLKNKEKNNSGYEKQIKDKSIILMGTTDKVFEQVVLPNIRSYPSPLFNMSSLFGELLDSYEFSVKSDNFNFQGSIITKNKEENSLKYFCTTLDRAIIDLIPF